MKTFYLSILLLFFCFGSFAQSITLTRAISQGVKDNSVICSGRKVFVSYQTNGSFNADNKLLLEYKIGSYNTNWQSIAFRDSANTLIADLPSINQLRISGESSMISFRVRSTSPSITSNSSLTWLSGQPIVELLGLSKYQAFPTETISATLKVEGMFTVDATFSNGQFFTLEGNAEFSEKIATVNLRASKSDTFSIKKVEGFCGVGTSSGSKFLKVSDHFLQVLSSKTNLCTGQTFRAQIQKNGKWESNNKYFFRFTEYVYPASNKYIDVPANEVGGYWEAVMPADMPSKFYTVQACSSNPSVYSNVSPTIVTVYQEPKLSFSPRELATPYGTEVNLNFRSNSIYPTSLKLSSGENFYFGGSTSSSVYLNPKISGFYKIDTYNTFCGTFSGTDSVKITLNQAISAEAISVSEVCVGGSFEVGFSSNVAIKIGEKIYASYTSSEESFKLEGVVISPNLARFKVPSDFSPKSVYKYYLQLWTDAIPRNGYQTSTGIRFRRIPSVNLSLPIYDNQSTNLDVPSNVNIYYNFNDAGPVKLTFSNGDSLEILNGDARYYYVKNTHTLGVVSAKNICGVNNSIISKLAFTVKNAEKSMVLNCDIPNGGLACVGTKVNMTLNTTGNFESGSRFLVDVVDYSNNIIIENIAEIVDGKANWVVPTLSDYKDLILRVRCSTSPVTSNKFVLRVKDKATFSSSEKKRIITTDDNFSDGIFFRPYGGQPYTIKTKEGGAYVFTQEGSSIIETTVKKSTTFSLKEISNECGTTEITGFDFQVFLKDKVINARNYYQELSICKGTKMQIPLQIENSSKYSTNRAYRLKLEIVSEVGYGQVRRTLLSDISVPNIEFTIPDDIAPGLYTLEVSDMDNPANDKLLISMTYKEVPSSTNLKFSLRNTDPVNVGGVIKLDYTNNTGTPLSIQLVSTNNLYQGTITTGSNEFVFRPSESSNITAIKAINQCGLSEIPVNLSVTVKPVIFWNYLKGSTYCRDEKVSINVNAQGVFSNKKLNLVIKDGYTAKEYNVLSVTENGQYSFTIPKDLTTGDHYIELRSSAGEAEASVSFLFLKEKPVVSVVGSATINTGQTTYLKVISSSLGKYFGRDFSSDLLNYILSDGSSNTMSFSGNNNYVFIPVSPKASTTLTFASVSNLCGVGTVTGSAQIIVNPVSAKFVEITSLENQETIQYYNYACGNQTIKVNFKLTGNYDTGTIYDLYMSDSVGNNFVKIPIISQTSNTLSATLPEVAATGFGYRFKVVANTSNSTSTTSPFPITIHKIPTAQFDSTNVYVIPGQTPALTISTIGALPIKILLKDDNAVFYNYTTTTPKISIPVSAPMGTKFLIGSVSNNLCAGRVGSKSQAQLLIVTGIEELSDWGIRVAPNPTEGALTLLNVVKDARLNIYDSLGKLVLEKALNQGDNLIDIGLQPSGIYFFSVESSTKKVVLKVQKY